MSLTSEKRLPFIGTEGRKKVVERALAFAPNLAEAFRIPEAAIRASQLLGCGNYGCTLLVPGLPRDRSVLKITSDNLEGNAAARILEEGDAPAGIVKIHKVVRLGRCSINSRMRPLEYKQAVAPFGGRTQTVRYMGPGAPYRPLWALQREELDDAWPHLKALGVKKIDVDNATMVFSRFARDLMMYNTSFGRPNRFGYAMKPDGDEIDAAAKLVHGEALVEAIEWLIERDMSWLDMRKVVNLGWRPGTGLVIRDVGATEAGANVLDDIETVGGARGRR